MVKRFFPHLLPVLLAGVGLFSFSRAAAQSVAVTYNFTSALAGMNSDGAGPSAKLFLSGNSLYGTTAYGGAYGYGTVFRVGTNGLNFTNLYDFTGDADGYSPSAVVVSGNALYGTTYGGGSSLQGSVFRLNTDGNGFTNLYSFTGVAGARPDANPDGARPLAGLLLSGNTLYGVAAYGGSFNAGTVFEINTDGNGFTNVHSFAFDSDGAKPKSALILSGNTLYGTTSSGGTASGGTVFKVNPDGSGFTKLCDLAGLTEQDGYTSSLVLSSNTLYGTKIYGGTYGGMVFAIGTNGAGFADLHDFALTDGIYPQADLALSGGALYGTTTQGGNQSGGTIFSLNSNGTAFTNLYDFTGIGDGSHPQAGLVWSGNVFYGTTYYGGASGYGTVFAFSPELPRLTLTLVGTDAVVKWPLSSRFTLESATDLIPPADWSFVYAYPVVVDGQNTVTNPVSGAQQFFRLIQLPPSSGGGGGD